MADPLTLSWLLEQALVFSAGRLAATGLDQLRVDLAEDLQSHIDAWFADLAKHERYAFSGLVDGQADGQQRLSIFDAKDLLQLVQRRGWRSLMDARWATLRPKLTDGIRDAVPEARVEQQFDRLAETLAEACRSNADVRDHLAISGIAHQLAAAEQVEDGLARLGLLLAKLTTQLNQDYDEDFIALEYATGEALRQRRPEIFVEPQLEPWDQTGHMRFRMGYRGLDAARLCLAPRTRLLIGAGAGYGKSSLLQWLARCSLDAETSPDFRLRRRLPLIIDLRSVFPTPGTMPLPPWLHLREICGVEVQALRRMVQGGRLAILVDGLDEAEGSTEDAVRWLENLGRTMGRCPVVVTSREATMPVGATLPSPWKTWRLAPLDGDGIRQHIARWADRPGGVDIDALVSLWQEDQRTWGIVTNPLWLSSLRRIYEDSAGDAELLKNPQAGRICDAFIDAAIAQRMGDDGDPSPDDDEPGTPDESEHGQLPQTPSAVRAELCRAARAIADARAGVHALPPPPGATMLAALLRTGLMRASGAPPGFAFEHDVIRQGLLASAVARNQLLDDPSRPLDRLELLQRRQTLGWESVPLLWADIAHHRQVLDFMGCCLDTGRDFDLALALRLLIQTRERFHDDDVRTAVKQLVRHPGMGSAPSARGNAASSWFADAYAPCPGLGIRWRESIALDEDFRSGSSENPYSTAFSVARYLADLVADGLLEWADVRDGLARGERASPIAWLAFYWDPPPDPADLASWLRACPLAEPTRARAVGLGRWLARAEPTVARRLLVDRQAESDLSDVVHPALLVAFKDLVAEALLDPVAQARLGGLVQLAHDLIDLPVNRDALWSTWHADHRRDLLRMAIGFLRHRPTVVPFLEHLLSRRTPSGYLANTRAELDALRRVLPPEAGGHALTTDEADALRDRLSNWKAVVEEAGSFYLSAVSREHEPRGGLFVVLTAGEVADRPAGVVWSWRAGNDGPVDLLDDTGLAEARAWTADILARPTHQSPQNAR